MEPASPRRPARRSCLRTRVETSGQRLTIQYRRFEASGCFLVLWLIGWTVGCVFLLGLVLTEPTLMHLAFAIPFWASWIFVFCWVMNSFFRREYFELGPEGIEFLCRVVIPIKRCTIPLGEIQGFDSYSKLTDSESNTRAWGLEVHTHGQGLRFGQGLSDDERAWLIDQLQTHLSHLMPNHNRGGMNLPVSNDIETPEDPQHAAQQEEPRSVERLTGAETPLDPPSDSRWMRLDDFHQITFVTRGRLGCGALGMLLFFNAFWNGIVSVFLMQLFGGEDGLEGVGWWALFVFLIPFEVIGVLMFVALLAALVEPLRRTRWSFAYGGAEWQTTWLGIGPHRSYPVDQLDRIELRISGQERFSFRSTDQDSSPVTSAYRLVFIDKNDLEQFIIDGLTQGEARWIADVILRECQRWFR
jgi:hypothetical protein